LIGSADFFEWLCQNHDRIASRNQESLREVIEYCGRAKLEIVAVDLEDRLGKRALLNFGHTVGHAVESLAGYGSYLHGEAVSIGMVFALALGAKLGFGSSAMIDRTADLLESWGLPISIPDELLKRSLLPRWEEALRADKKRISDAIEYIVLKEIGVATTVDIEMEIVIEAIGEKV
jgi:3-dehydroquinate synthase